jgi:hypothetical protein
MRIETSWLVLQFFMNNKSLVFRGITQPTEILSQLQTGQLLRVKGCRSSGLIICHRHHSELAGPGAAVGGVFDLKCSRVIPIGRVSIVYPETYPERRQAYVLRQRWMLFTQKAMESWVPLQRAKRLLLMLDQYFDPQLIDELPDEVLAQLIGVLPKTIGMMRQTLQSQRENKSQAPQVNDSLLNSTF